MKKEQKATSIMIVGVGGQGTLLASKLLGAVVRRSGCDVKVSEVHGMSQRGGSVVTYVRYGNTVASPVIELGEADCILAFEELEAARYLPYLKRDGLMIVNTRQIDPMPVILGAAKAPEQIAGKLRAHPVNLETLDALAMAELAGSAKAVNLVLMGQFARHTEFTRQEWEDAIRDTVPKKFLEMNLKAFHSSYLG